MRSTFLLVSVLLAACSETPAPINEAKVTPPAVEQIKEPTIEATTAIVAPEKCNTPLTGYAVSLSGDTSHICGEIGSYLRGDVTNISGDVTGLNGNVTDLSGDVSNIDGWVSITGDVTNLRGELGQYLKGDVSDLSGDVTGLNGNVTDLSGDVSNIDGWIDAGKSYGDVSDLVGNIDCLAGDLASLSGNVSDLNARICKETRIKELRTELDQLTRQ